MGMERMSQGKTLKPNLKSGKMTVTLLILLMLSLTLCCFLNESIAFFNNPNNKWMSDVEFFLAFAASFLSSLLYILVCHRYGKAKFKPHYLILFSALWIGNFIGVYMFPNIKTGVINRYTGYQQGFAYVISDMERLRFVLMFFMSCVNFYCLFALAPQVMRGKHSLNVLFSAVVFVTLFVIVYSFATEYTVYLKYFDIKAEVGTGDYVASCFNNRNTYGTILLMGLCCLGYMQCESRHWWYYLLMLFIFFCVMVTLSKTSILCSAIFLIPYMIYRFIQTVRFHPIKDIIALILIFGAIGFLIYARRSDIEILKNNILTKLYDNFLAALSRRVEGTFMEDRTEIWYAIGDLLDTPMAKIFGVGDVNIYFLLAYAFGKFDGPVPLYFAHNGFVHAFGAGGFLRLGIYFIVLFLFLYKAIKAALRHSTTAIASILIFLTILVHGMAETTGFLMPDTKGMVLLVFVYLPVLVEGKKVVELDTDEPFRGGIKFKYTLSPVRKTALWMSLYIPFLIYALALSEPLTRVFATKFSSEYWYLVGSVIALTYPLGIFLSYSTRSKFFGGFIRAAFFALFFASFLLLYFIDSPGLMLLPIILIPLFLAFLAGFHAPHLSRGLWGKLWLLYLVSVSVLVAFVGFNHWTTFQANWFRTSTPTGTALYIVSNALLYLVLLGGTPLSKVLIYPIDQLVLHIDEKISFFSRRYEVKVAKKNREYLTKRKRRRGSRYFA